MALFHKCGIGKILLGSPSVLAFALIIYISVVFMFEFIPRVHPHITFGRILLSIIFTWFSLNTLVAITRIIVSDPGYVSEKYKHPLKHDGEAPLE